MDAHYEDSAEIADEVHISHFIPSVELKGSTTQKLQKLDTLIAYLHRLRAALAGDIPSDFAASESLVWPTARVSWPSFGAGVACAALLLLLIAAGRCG